MKKPSQFALKSRSCFASLVLICALALAGFDSPEDVLLSRVRSGVSDNLRLIPRYTCVQTVNRTRYTMPVPPRSCQDAVAFETKRVAAWRDRLRLDVAVGQGGDLYSWVGASRFDSDQVRQLAARGMSASGEFSALLSGVFGGDAGDFRFLGYGDAAAGKLAAFSFATALATSHYSFSTRSGHQTVGYHGTFLADPVSGDLRQLTVDAENLPANVCRMESSVDYARLKIGSGDFVLPVTSSVEVLYMDGAESRNETSYSGCRQYTGESTVRFDEGEDAASSTASAKANAAPLPPIPPRTRIRVRIAPQVDPRTAAAGDPIIGVIDGQVKEQGRVVIAAGDTLRGRILRLEQVIPSASTMLNTALPNAQQMKNAIQCAACAPPKPDTHPHWIVAIVFDTVVHGGVEQKVTLKPIDDGYRFDTANRAIANSERPAGGGLFIFQDDGNIVLGQKFESAWETQ